MATKKPAGAKALAQLEDVLRAERELRIHHVTEHMRHSIRNIALQADVIERAETNRQNAAARTVAGATAILFLAHEQGYIAASARRGDRKAFVLTAMDRLSPDPNVEVPQRTIERWLAFATQNHLLP
jgi:hypothetical protein